MQATYRRRRLRLGASLALAAMVLVVLHASGSLAASTEGRPNTPKRS